MKLTNLSKLAWLLPIGLLISGVFFGSLRRMSDPDIWFQLLSAQYVLDQGTVPHTDFYVYAGQGARQIFGGWAFGLLYLIPIKAFGLPASTFINSIIWSASFFFALDAAKLRANRTWNELPHIYFLSLSLAVSFIFLTLSVRMTMRAEQTLILAWCFGIWLCEWSRETGSPRTFLIGMPLVAWLESWLHTGGFVLLAISPIAFSRLHNVAYKSPRAYLVWGYFTIALALLPILNPNGADQAYLHLRALLTSSSDATHIYHNNTEYLPIWDVRMADLVIRYCFLAVALCLISLRPRSMRNFIELAICAFFVTISAFYSRGISLACMVLMVPLMELALHPSLLQARVKSLYAFLTAIVFCCLPIIISKSTSKVEIQGKVGALESTAKLIKKLRPEGANIFTMEDGPQLAYFLNDRRFLISSKNHVVIYNDNLNKHIIKVLKLEGDWEADLVKYKVDFVCLPLHLASRGAGMFYNVNMVLAARGDWRYHGLNGPCALLERLSPEHELSEGAVEDQMLRYFAELKGVTLASYELKGDMRAKEISELVTKEIDNIIERRKLQAIK